MVSVKREAGVSPARTRRCKKGVLLQALGNSLKAEPLGRGSKALIFKSEDLPVIRTVDHEDLVSAE